MKIHKLRIVNLKKISELSLVPEGSLVVISGKNGEGKTTVLDGIMTCLGGASHITSKPVRKGEDKATIEIDLGDITVKRTISPVGDTQIIVRDKDGIRMESPQKVLDKLYGRLTFDPLEFRSQKATARYETLRDLMGLNFESIDAEIKKIFEQRTIVNREVDSVAAKLRAQQEYPNAPKEEQSVEAVLEEQKKAAEQNAFNADNRKKLETLGNSISAGERTLKALSDQIAEAEKRVKELKGRYDVETETIQNLRSRHQEAITHVEKLQDIPLEPFREKIRQVAGQNEQVRANRVKAELREDLKRKSYEAETLTSGIERLDKQKKAKIAEAKFPVEGLSLSDTREVLYNGIPFDQASTGEQIRVSVAMGLALNTQLRILLIRQGNDLDEDNLKLVAEMAEKADAQIWLERVTAFGENTVVLEEGHLKEAA